MAKIVFLKPPCVQFNGKPTHYHTWKRNFDTQVDELRLKPHETRRALVAHTSGEALKVVEAFRDASIGNTEATLERILRARGLKVRQKLHDVFFNQQESGGT